MYKIPLRKDINTKIKLISTPPHLICLSLIPNPNNDLIPKKLPAEYSKHLKMKNFNIDLFWGIKSSDFSSAGKVNIHVDLLCDKVLLSEKDKAKSCTGENDCEYVSGEIEEGEYRERAFSYKKAKTFMDFDSLLKGQVKDEEERKSLKNFEVLMVQDQKLGNISYI